MERVKGIEPSYEAWEAAVLPLNYTRTGANSSSRPAARSSATPDQAAPPLLGEISAARRAGRTLQVREQAAPAFAARGEQRPIAAQVVVVQRERWPLHLH